MTNIDENEDLSIEIEALKKIIFEQEKMIAVLHSEIFDIQRKSLDLRCIRWKDLKKIVISIVKRISTEISKN